MKVSKTFILSLFVVLMISCNNDYYPKPRDYFRIDLPEKSYQSFDTNFPYQFEYPEYAEIIFDTLPSAEPYWINIHFDQFKGTIHLSYKKINNNLREYLEDTRTMAMKHIPKASGIENRQFADEADRIFGLVYDISGSGAASPYQFYVTDSVKNFVRGALYFNTVPNNDSLAPVIKFLEEDINHMIETFRWKKDAE